MNTDDPRIIDGMRRQGELLQARRADGATLIGFKAGLGTAAALAKLGTSAPVTGFLTDQTLIESGGAVSIAAHGNPTFEPELAVRLGRDLAAGGSAQDALEAIDAIAPAIELVDLGAPDDLAAVLAGNIFHRAVALGTFVAADPAAVTGARLDVYVDDDARAQSVAPSDVLGPVAEVVARLADQAPLAGVTLAAGTIVITGSAIAAIALTGPARLQVRLAGAGAVSLTTTA